MNLIGGDACIRDGFANRSKFAVGDRNIRRLNIRRRRFGEVPNGGHDGGQHKLHQGNRQPSLAASSSPPKFKLRHYRAPIVRNRPEGREFTMARWGMPSPVLALKGRNSDTGVTNIRNVKSPHWRRWLGIEHRCVVPFTSFSENEPLADGSKPPVWFALDEARPLARFAGISTPTSIRKVKGDAQDSFAMRSSPLASPSAAALPMTRRLLPDQSRSTAANLDGNPL
jgi:hypothetical protein